MPETTCERCGEGFSAAARRGYCDTCVSHYDGARRANADALEPCVYRRDSSPRQESTRCATATDR